MFLCFGTGCPAAGFDDLWKQVEKYERQDLPGNLLIKVSGTDSRQRRQREAKRSADGSFALRLQAPSGHRAR